MIPQNLSVQAGLEWPNVTDLTPTGVERWFANISRELSMDILSDKERDYLSQYYEEAGLLRSWRRPFFHRHYADSVAAATKHLFAAGPHPTILDLGCGSGSQSLLFALMGAKVIGVDMDSLALEIFRKRKVVYEKAAGRSLDIEIIEGNAFEIDYGAHAPFDGVYSLFAFNMMQPSVALVDRIIPHFSTGAKWAVLDGNQSSFWSRLFAAYRRNVWTPEDMCEQLKIRGFTEFDQRGGVVLPPLLWSVLPRSVAQWIDLSLSRDMFWPISCQTLATFQSSAKRSIE